MTKVDDYRHTLRALHEWDEFLLQSSGLPGPRGNLELARAVAFEGTLDTFRRYAEYDATRAPVNSPQEYLAFCGVLGFGRLVAEGDTDLIPELRAHASDSRWRTREAVAMAVQWWADSNMEAALREMDSWASGSLLERRAAVAALCEPRLLRDPVHTACVLKILERVTSSVTKEPERRSDEFRALRKALGYCWSVAIVAQPQIGIPAFSAWLTCNDKDVRWLLRQNLKKKRLLRMDSAWVDSATTQLAVSARTN